MTDTDRILTWLREAMGAAEETALATTPVPVAGEWAAVRDKHADETAPLELIQGRDEYEPGYQGYSSGVPVIAIAADWQDEAEANLRHIALHDPAAVLRRITADRRALERHWPRETLAVVEAPNKVGRVTICDHDRKPWPCPDITDLAESWGWTEETT